MSPAAGNKTATRCSAQQAAGVTGVQMSFVLSAVLLDMVLGLKYFSSIATQVSRCGGK